MSLKNYILWKTARHVQQNDKHLSLYTQYMIAFANSSAKSYNKNQQTGLTLADWSTILNGQSYCSILLCLLRTDSFSLIQYDFQNAPLMLSVRNPVPWKNSSCEMNNLYHDYASRYFNQSSVETEHGWKKIVCVLSVLWKQKQNQVISIVYYWFYR